MTNPPSLFARKLRDWRASNGAHGRMTQETLAEALGVSVDAISKYERSASFIRGDLEHRLAERLGWTRDNILACREDWQARNQRQAQSAYQLLDDTLVDRYFGGSWRYAINDMITMAQSEFDFLPDELAPDRDLYLPIYDTYPDNWRAVLHKDQIVAKWSLLFLRPEHEEAFRKGNLIESELTVDRLNRLLLPGTYFGYCPALIILKRHEAAASLLLSSFVRFLEALAERDILLHGIGTISCSPGGAQVCRDLGMTRHGAYFMDSAFGIWELPGNAIANSIFARRSPLLRRRYAEAYGG